MTDALGELVPAGLRRDGAARFYPGSRERILSTPQRSLRSIVSIFIKTGLSPRLRNSRLPRACY